MERKKITMLKKRAIVVVVQHVLNPTTCCSETDSYCQMEMLTFGDIQYIERREAIPLRACIPTVLFTYTYSSKADSMFIIVPSSGLNLVSLLSM